MSVEELVKQHRNWADINEKRFKPMAAGFHTATADKLEELAAEVNGWKIAWECLRKQNEAALAEKDKEIAALRTSLKETQSNLKAGSTRRAVIRLIDEVLARNAGGTDG